MLMGTPHRPAGVIAAGDTAVAACVYISVSLHAKQSVTYRLAIYSGKTII
jgi:hypothetical protein